MKKDDCKKQVPLVFVLMSRRQTTDYVAVFNKLKDVLTEPDGVSPEVEEFVVDFESGMSMVKW